MSTWDNWNEIAGEIAQRVSKRARKLLSCTLEAAMEVTQEVLTHLSERGSRLPELLKPDGSVDATRRENYFLTCVRHRFMRLAGQDGLRRNAEQAYAQQRFGIEVVHGSSFSQRLLAVEE